MTTDELMTVSAKLHLPSDCFLNDVFVVDCESGSAGSLGDAPLDAMVAATLASGTAIVNSDEKAIPGDASSILTIPVYRGQTLVNVVVLKSRRGGHSADAPVGVFEVWTPVGEHDEVAMTSGYYGKMERFHNVSSFVRFEKGMGLPGLVWQDAAAVIQDDLSNHPGFLRAAGASADALQTAIGIPVIADGFQACVVLISALGSPIARGFEVWQVADEGFELVGGAYHGLDPGFALSAGTKAGTDDGLLGLCTRAGGAVVSDDTNLILWGRETSTEAVPSAALAIPQFDGETLRSIATLLF